MDTQSLVATRRKFKSTQLFVVAGTILVSLLISLLCVGLTVRYEVDTETADVKSIQYWKLNLPPEQDYWYEKGIEELKSIIVKKENYGEVENIVIFIVEGVNSDILSRARFVKQGNTTAVNNFVWETFPHLGILKSSCSFEEQCDAFTLSTALFGGVKTSKRLGGVDARVAVGNCVQALNETYHVSSIFKQAKAINLRTGFVTTRRVSGPLVAGLYAHSSNTQWECNNFMSPKSKGMVECLDVASQLINSKEGKNINVIMGGGRQALMSTAAASNLSTSDESTCVSLYSRDLLQTWQSYKIKQNVTYKLIETGKDLESLKGLTTDYILGVFANGDLNGKDPKLINMVAKSLDVLKRNNNGFLFLAETEIKSKNLENFQEKLLDLDGTIRKSIEHPSFTPNNTVLLTVFLDLNHTGNGPNDIILHATGPKSFLFHGVHEETYMAHVISYYLKMGIFRSPTSSRRKTNF